MRILSLIGSLRIGGAESVATDLAIGLRHHEHRLAHFSSENGAEVYAPYVDAMRAAGVPALDVHWDPAHAGTLDRVLEGGWSPDVLLVHWWGNDPFTAWLAAVRGRASDRTVRSICVLHDSRGRPPPGHDRYVLVSRTQQPQVDFVPAERVTVIPNGVDLRRFHPDGRGGSNGTFTVGRVSNLHVNKVPHDWVRTLAASGLSDARFVIAGEGAQRQPLIEDARRLGVADRFAFPGLVPRDRVPDLLRTFDVFCYATSTAVECHPLALIEAAATELPIVAEARGGVPEIVEHGVSGLLADSPEEIGTHLRHLRADEDLRRTLGHGARKVAARSSLARHLDAYAALIEDVAASPAASA